MSRRKITITGLVVAGLMALIGGLVAFLVHEELVWYTTHREVPEPVTAEPGPRYGDIVGGEITDEDTRCDFCAETLAEGTMRWRWLKYGPKNRAGTVPFHDKCWEEEGNDVLAQQP